MKQAASLVEINITVGFMYWLQESPNLRGLRDVSITNYHSKLITLQETYARKYPNGLTGWSKT